MKARPDCLACVHKQAENTARCATRDPELQRQVLRKVAEYAKTASLDQTPAALSYPLYGIVAEVTGVKDPYGKQKEETNRTALALAPDLKRLIEGSRDPLDTAVHVAAAGNIIDLGIGHAFDIDQDVLAIVKQKFRINALEDFRKELGSGLKLLYLGDNAGEIVFDSLLVEHIVKAGARVTFAVKSGPIINDATMEDAAVAGLTELVEVIETGSNDIGINWKNVSGRFMKAVRNADVILGKGHGNFETCHDRPGNFYFLLKVKCRMVADELGVKVGDIVFSRSSTGS